jgi:hypothetical protein
MFDGLRISGWRMIVVAFYAVAMLTLGFAHSRAGMPGGLASLDAAQAAAYALPDGTLPPICGQTKPGAPNDHHGLALCDACHLASAPGILSAPPVLLDLPRVGMKLPPARAIASIAEAAALEPQSRGPPRLS